jgi:hypothetical protein
MSDDRNQSPMASPVGLRDDEGHRRRREFCNWQKPSDMLEYLQMRQQTASEGPFRATVLAQ